MLCSTEYLRFFAITYLSRLSLTLITLLHSIAQDELYFVTTGDLSPGTEMVNIKYINITILKIFAMICDSRKNYHLHSRHSTPKKTPRSSSGPAGQRLGAIR